MKKIRAKVAAHKSTRSWLTCCGREPLTPRDLGYEEDELQLRDEIRQQRRMVDAALVYADACLSAMESLYSAQGALAAGGIDSFKLALPTSIALEQRLYQSVGVLRQTFIGIKPRLDFMQKAIQASEASVKKADDALVTFHHYTEKVKALRATMGVHLVDAPVGSVPQTKRERTAEAKLQRNEMKLRNSDEAACNARRKAIEDLRTCASRKVSVNETVARILDSFVEALGSSVARVPLSSATVAASAVKSSPNPFDDDISEKQPPLSPFPGHRLKTQVHAATPALGGTVPADTAHSVSVSTIASVSGFGDKAEETHMPNPFDDGEDQSDGDVDVHTEDVVSPGGQQSVAHVGGGRAAVPSSTSAATEPAFKDFDHLATRGPASAAPSSAAAAQSATAVQSAPAVQSAVNPFDEEFDDKQLARSPVAAQSLSNEVDIKS